MVDLTSRQRELLSALCRRRTYMTTKELSDVVGVSVRTVRSDLRVITAFVQSIDAVLERSAGKGVRLSCDAAVRERIAGLVSSATLQSVLSIQECGIVAEMLLMMRQTVTFQEIADVCRVSRQTIRAHFGAVERFFEKQSVSVVRSQGVGLQLFGNELDIRRCFLGVASDTGAAPTAFQVVRHVLTADEKRFVEETVSLMESAGQIPGCDDGLLSACVALSYVRSKAGCVLKNGSFVAERAQILPDPGKEGSRFDALDRLLKGRIDCKGEREFLVAVALSRRAGGTALSELGADDAATQISQRLIRELCALHNGEIEPTQNLVDGLTAHLRAAIWRVRNGNQIQSETSVQVAASIPLLYDFTRAQMGCVEREWGICFNESEVAYIAMYLDTIWETGAQGAAELSVLFVCAFGLASSSMLMMRLSQMLADCHLLGPMSPDDARMKMGQTEVDLIISTTPLEFESVPVLVVDPLLSQAALDEVRRALVRAAYAKMCAYFLHAYACSPVSNAEPIRIGDLVRRADVQVGVRCTDWRSAIRVAAWPLLERGAIEDRYVDRMVRAVEDFGPYMVLTPGCAYVHAGINDGVREDCVAICVLSRAIPFGAAGEKPVRVIVVLGVRDKKRSVLLDIAPILERAENMRVLESGDVDISDVLELR